jgi:hypothetical protein
MLTSVYFNENKPEEEISSLIFLGLFTSITKTLPSTAHPKTNIIPVFILQIV